MSWIVVIHTTMLWLWCFGPLILLYYHTTILSLEAQRQLVFCLFFFFCDLGIDNKLSQVNALSSKPITPIVWGKNVPSCKRLDHRITWMTTLNWPLPSSKNPHFQNEAKYTTFLVEMSFICILKAEHLTSSWYRGSGKLGSGLLRSRLP